MTPAPMAKPDLTVETAPTSAAELLDGQSRYAGRATHFTTGFTPLDDAFGGGIRSQDLIVVGGRPGVGKTVVTLQWARWMAMSGQTVVYACYEHDERSLLWRLLMSEVRSLLSAEEASGFGDDLRDTVEAVVLGRAQETGTTVHADVVARAAARVRSYADRLLLVRASGSHTNVPALDRLVAKAIDGDGVLCLDYLQKIPNGPTPLPELDHIARVARGLKELAVARDVSVVAVASMDHLGLTVPRARLHHIRGAEAIAYEADLVVMLNDKMTAVSKAHRAFDPVRARTFHDRVVFSIEKNRRAKAFLDLEFTKEFAFSRFDPEGAYVADRLVDELVDEA